MHFDFSEKHYYTGPVSPLACVSLCITCWHEKVEVVWEDRKHIDDIHGSLDKVTFLRGAGKPGVQRFCALIIFLTSTSSKVPEEVLDSEPGYADRLYQGQLRILLLKVWHGGQDHAHCRDYDKEDGDVGDHLGCLWCLWLLYQIPKADLVLDKLASSKVFWSFCFEDACLGKNDNLIQLNTNWIINISRWF